MELTDMDNVNDQETSESVMEIDDHSYSVHSGNLVPNEPTPKEYNSFNNVITAFMLEQGIPGGTFVLTFNGKLIYKQGYGVAGAGRRVTSESVFRIASITKPITAIAIMKLVQDGRLSLDQKVFGSKGGILTEYQPTKKNGRLLPHITVEHLLQHSSGWDRDMNGDVVFFPVSLIMRACISVMTFKEQLIKYMMAKKTEFTPGKRHAYSNFGYLVLGCIIEKVTQMPYLDYISTILHSTDLKDFHVGYEKRILADYDEVEYFETITEPVNSIFPNEGKLLLPQYGGMRMRDTESYGGLVASASQLMKLFSIFDQNSSQSLDSILTQDTVDKMLQRPRYAHLDHWYGFGLEVQDDGKTWGHTGYMDGSSGTFMKHKSGLSWVLLFNSGSKDMDLDGLVKYGLSLVPKSPLWESSSISSNLKCFDTDVRIVSSNQDQVVHLLLPLQQLDSHVEEMKVKGYKVREINLVNKCDTTFVNIVWQKNINKTEWIIETVYQSYKDPHYLWLNQKINTSFEMGYKFTCLSTCFVDPQILFVMVLEKKSSNVSQYVHFATRDLSILEKEKNAKKDKFHVVIQSVCRINGLSYVTAVFECEEGKSDVRGHIASPNMLVANFQYALQKHAEKKSGLTFLQFFSDASSNKVFVSAIWSPRKKQNCYQRYHMSRYGFFYELAESARNNVPLEYLSAYMYDGVLNFAAIWAAGPFK